MWCQWVGAGVQVGCCATCSMAYHRRQHMYLTEHALSLPNATWACQGDDPACCRLPPGARLAGAPCTVVYTSQPLLSPLVMSAGTVAVSLCKLYPSQGCPLSLSLPTALPLLLAPKTEVA